MASKIIQIGVCDGSSREATLERQLIKNGLMAQKWSMSDDTPGTVFFWFKHVAAQVYEPDMMEPNETKDWHCGVCYTAIKHLYHFRGGGIVNFAKDIDVSLPPVIVSGSECIWLGKELKALTNYLVSSKYVVGPVRYTRGRIDAQCLFDSFDQWPYDEFVLPLQWFYLKPNQRRGLSRTINGWDRATQVLSWWKSKDDSIPKLMNHIRKSEARYGLGEKFWNGTDIDGKTMATIDTDSQVAEPNRFIVVSRTDARIMARPSVYMRRMLANDK